MPPLLLSLLVNAAIVVLLCSMSIGGCSVPKEEIVPMEFLVVTEENAADTLAEEPNDAREEEPEPEPEPEPPKPEPLPPPPPVLPEPDPLPPPPPAEEPKAKPKPEKPKEKPKAEKPKEKPKWKPATTIKTGKRIGPVTDGRKDRTKAATQKALSKEEIAKFLAAGAKSGNRNQIPSNEASRCYGVIAARFREACTDYGLESSPTGKSPVLTLRLGSGGAVRSVTLKTSSGDRTFDGQVLQAARTVRSVSGLSAAFLRDYPAVDIQVNVD